MFNVGPVVRQEDGTVVSVELIRRRGEKEAGRVHDLPAQRHSLDETTHSQQNGFEMNRSHCHDISVSNNPLPGNINPDRLAKMENQQSRKLSKTNQKKLAALEPRPPPPKPVMPEGIFPPPNEEDWLVLWDLSDEQIERRVIREKKRKAAERKALRIKQQSGKAERREARDEKRKVYREIKLVWKAMKGKSNSF